MYTSNTISVKNRKKTPTRAPQTSRRLDHLPNNLRQKPVERSVSGLLTARRRTDTATSAAVWLSRISPDVQLCTELRHLLHLGLGNLACSAHTGRTEELLEFGVKVRA